MTLHFNVNCGFFLFLFQSKFLRKLYLSRLKYHAAFYAYSEPAKKEELNYI